MKLSEEIKAIEDGSESKYKSDGFCIYEAAGDILFNFDNSTRIYINPSRN